MTQLPPYFLSHKETVPQLLDLYAKKRIDLNNLSQAFIKDVKWEYRGVTGDLDWKGTNVWSAVYEAYQRQVLSPSDYMYIVNEYEKAQNYERI